jgi:hypothetical protein
MKEITVNVRSFEDIRTEGDYIYVDKTRYIYSLVRVKLRNYYFVSRPRRYGKSLMCSTLHALFEGKRDLFKGLYIDNTDYSFEKYPVIHLNFADYNTTSYEAFLNDFQIAITDEAERNGLTVTKGEPSTMLKAVLKDAGKKTAIIVDEYDSPIIDSYMDKEKADRIRNTLSMFYTVIKNNDGKVRFFFVTGITKFSNMSIFSKMNNLTDLTFDKNFAAAFGYTQEELEANFSDYIDAYMAREDREYETRREFLETVRDYYDGYSFSYRSEEKVYNPVSVGKFFQNDCEFDSYWENTGASTLAVSLARDYNLERIMTDDVELETRTINTFDYGYLRDKKLDDSQVLALIYFTGYLTIRSGNSNVLHLSFPNTEVREMFTKNLVAMFTGIKTSIFADMAVEAVRSGKTDEVVRVMNAYMNKYQYDTLDRAEKGYQEMFYSFFLMIGGVRVAAEDRTLLGRSDIVLTLKRDVYIIEIKVDKSAEAALRQIHDNGYYHKYINTEKTIHLIGLNFTSEKRQIDSWIEETVDKTKEPTYLG